MFIGKLRGAVFDPLPCLDKIMDGLLSSGITAQTQSWMLLVEVPLSKFVCSEVDPAVWEPSTVAGLQHDEEALCAWGFFVSHSQAFKCFKNCSHYCLSGLFAEFLFENKSPFAPLTLPTDIPCWICVFVFHHLRSKLSVEVRGV